MPAEQLFFFIFEFFIEMSTKVRKGQSKRFLGYNNISEKEILKMSKKIETENYLREHFLECYLADYDYEELPRIIREYKKTEEVFISEGLLRELTLLKERGDWYYVQTFVRKHGLRKLSIKKLQAMFDLMINELTSKN